ncbi:TetR/AcrR family transcriptional regulator [Enterobacter cloacae]|uniref:TetR/AcrR family transcriptional regulator n=1 Tax=Enterobacter cloacae complex TaxID=354276 RepID=UPI0021474466|nr:MULTISPECIES: TetR/AcrR family transcriptional regulator [Enterobacter cloacae complex]MCR6728593.1 TetR/AcrR family transcriptional regulator [Enterobacter cloacae]UUR75396.1 TetR/AcrR family transcriptional regulator [Enterobacter cloacae complex sp. R_G8]
MFERSQKAREIMANTRQLLTTGGYKSFSYADLAERVGIRKASIHHHFPAKEDLVKAVVQEYRAEAQAGMAAMDRQINDPLVKVKSYADFWSTCIKDGSSPFCICVMLAVELPTLPPDIAAEVTGHFSDLSDWLASLLRAGEAQGVFQLKDSAEAEARALMAGIHGAMLAARAFNNPQVFDQIAWPLINNVVKVA